MDDREMDYVTANEISATEDPPTILLTIRVHGERQIEVDREAYEAAKFDGKVDHFLDMDLSDLDTDSTVIEPGGVEYDPIAQPHGPAEVSA